ncbi:MAG: ABC transporter permease, partial [Rhodoglobus sp.]|nr:ABC transporter permease [Rhodoglobus sp.]
MTTYSLPLSKKKRAVKTRPPRDALFIAAACALGLIVLVAVAAAVIPFAGDPARIVGPRLSPPSAAYPFGTDALGRSVLARL